MIVLRLSHCPSSARFHAASQTPVYALPAFRASSSNSIWGGTGRGAAGSAWLFEAVVLSVEDGNAWLSSPHSTVWAFKGPSSSSCDLRLRAGRYQAESRCRRRRGGAG